MFGLVRIFMNFQKWHIMLWLVWIMFRLVWFMFWLVWIIWSGGYKDRDRQCSALSLIMPGFECDRRDRSLMLTCDCPCAGGKYEANNQKNVGLKQGRMKSFPRYSFPITEDQINRIASLGLYWSFCRTSANGALACIGCRFCLEDWNPEMDMFGEHKRQVPNCPLWAARELGYETEVMFHPNSLPCPLASK